RGLAFLPNNPRATADDIRRRLWALGITFAEHTLTPLEIIGEVIARRFGPSRVLVIGAPELGDVIARAGHEIVETKDYRRATVVAVGNDFDLTYERLTAAARAAAAGAPLVTPNVDPRLPLEGGEFLPGCGALVEAVAVAAGVRPVVVGKPEPPLFRIALERLGLESAATAMVGDSVVIARLVFGRSKLPELGRMVGRAMREFRRASDEFRQTVETNLNLNDLDPVSAPSSVPTVETAPPASASVPSSAEPFAAADAPAATATAAPAEPFCAQRGSRLFHRTECAWTARIPQAECLYFKHVADARE